jgi:transcriptional regulator with XRE-family HTH domain
MKARATNRTTGQMRRPVDLARELALVLDYHSTHDLAARTGVSRATLDAWRTGEIAPSVAELAALEDSLGTRRGTVLEAADYLPPFTVDDPMIQWSLMTSISADIVKAMLAVALKPPHAIAHKDDNEWRHARIVAAANDPPTPGPLNLAGGLTEVLNHVGPRETSGVANATLDAWRSGRRAPSIIDLAALEDALAVDRGEILSASGYFVDCNLERLIADDIRLHAIAKRMLLAALEVADAMPFHPQPPPLRGSQPGM